MPVVNIVNIPGARAAVFALFALKKWDKLPHLSVLLVDEDAAVLFRDPFSLSRAQIQYQFAIWLRTGGLVGAESSTLGDGQITATVDSRVGSSPELLQRTFAAVLRGPLVGCRPTFMPEVLKALIHDKHCNAFWESRVVELKSFVIKNFARRASSVRSHSSAFEMAINKSRSKWKKEWVGQARPAYVTTAFLSASMLDAYELVARNVDTLILLTFDFIDRELCAQFRKLFGPRGTARALVIPPFPGNEANSELVQQTLAYIAGGALSALQKASTVCEDSDSTLSALLKTFVATHSITKKSAGASGVPMKVIVDRSNGGLIFPSLEMFSLIVLIEHVFSSLLTMEPAANGSFPAPVIKTNFIEWIKLRVDVNIHNDCVFQAPFAIPVKHELIEFQPRRRSSSPFGLVVYSKFLDGTNDIAWKTPCAIYIAHCAVPYQGGRQMAKSIASLSIRLRCRGFGEELESLQRYAFTGLQENHSPVTSSRQCGQ